MSSNLIKTEREIFDKMTNSSEKKQWVDLSLLAAELHKKYNESFNLPGEFQDIREFGRMDSLRWALSLLGENP